MIRSASLTDYAALASALGLDPLRLARSVGIPRAALHDPDIKIRVSAVTQLLERSARAARLDDFGMRLAEKRRLSNLGPLGLMLREQLTVRKALEFMNRYASTHNEALELRITESEGTVILKPMLRFRRPLPVNQAIQLTIGVVYRIFATLLGSGWSPRSVAFTQGAPASLDACRRLFGMRATFNADFDGIVFASSDLELPIPDSDPVMARYVQRYLDSIVTRKNLSIAEKVREAVCMLLAAGNCSVDSVAERLGVDRRTVHRWLQEDGETFSGILNAVRTEMVARFIANRDRPLYVVAELLGFSGLSALSRWFKANFGCSISDWRNQNLRGVRGGRATREQKVVALPIRQREASRRQGASASRSRGRAVIR